MAIKSTKYNMSDIKDRVNAAELLQQAGQKDAAKKVLLDLADELREDDKNV